LQDVLVDAGHKRIPGAAPRGDLIMSRIAQTGTAVLFPPAVARAERTDLAPRGAMHATKQGLLVAGLMVAGAVAAQAALLVLVVGAPVVAGALLWRASRAPEA
jgi:hypothetical protein